MRQKYIPLNSLLIKPAGPDCNLDCEYCFYLEKDALFPETKTHRMSDQTLEVMIRNALEQSRGHISFAWQGGEPTLMGLPFFQNALQLQQKYSQGHHIENTFQTNGTLIDKEWATFLHENDFLLGLSLDGPAHIHDHYRVDKSGNPSFEKVRDAADLLLDHQVDVNALVVVNDYSVKYPEEIYKFHKDIGLDHMQFIPCVEHGNIHSTLAPYTVSAKEYGEFLCHIFDLWVQDIDDLVAKTSIRFFDSVFRKYVGHHPADCTLLANCGVYLTVEHDGSVYSCDFYVNPENLLGNIHDAKLVDMLNGEQQIGFGSAKSTLPQECQSCEWLGLCRGGCPKDRILEGDESGLHYLCESFKIFFAYADATFKSLAGAWQNQQAELANLNSILVRNELGETKV
ncbi:MAG: anaerobic sulfatase maturase [Candidatus Marinimicrobia bacterium]|nr:anaerobic sulfatase maturase [Candidatus Neomarinimicrobiota bacterium]